MDATLQHRRFFLLAVGLLAGLVAVLAGWWSMNHEAGSDKPVTRCLLQLKQMETHLDKQVLRLVSLDLANQDPVARALHRTRALSRRLEASDFAADPAIAHRVRRYLELRRRKADVIRRMQAQVAILRNSLLYVPGADATAADPRLESLASTLLVHELSPSRPSLDRLQGRMAAIRDNPPPGVAPADIELVLAHAEAALAATGRLESLRLTLAELPVEQSLDRLIAARSSQLADHNRRVATLGGLLTALVGVLVLALAYTLVRLRRAHVGSELTKRRLHDAIESLPEAFALFDARQRLIFWNRRLADFYPALRERLRPGLARESISEILRGGAYCSLAAHREDAPDAGGTYLQENDGHSYLASDSPTSEGGIVSLRTDISEQRRAELELRKLSLAVEHSPIGVVMTDRDGRLEYANPHYRRIIADDTPLEGRLPMVLDPAIHDAADAVWAAVAAGRNWRGELRAVRGDGEGFWQEVLVSPIADASGAPARLVILVEDITERRRNQEALRLAATVFEATSEAIMVTDHNNRIKAVNPAFTAITGYTTEEVTGENPRLLSSGRHFSGFYESMWQALNREGRWQGEIWNRRKDGVVYAEWLSIVAIHGPGGTVEEYVAIFSDITRQKQHEEEIQRQANFDELTGLVNRNLFRDRLRSTLAQARREARACALLFIDLDGFKLVNDSLGHGFGDALLRRVARRLESRARESDTLARLGGDEFTLLLSCIDDRHQAAGVAGELIESLSRPFAVDGHELRIGASVGITVFPEDADDDEDMVRKADLAMYAAKAAGKNTHVFFDPAMDDDVNQRLALENDLRRALAAGGEALELYYQPVVETGSGRITGFEALARWYHPEHGTIPAADFVPVAEQSSLIHELEEWALASACRQLAAWQDAGLEVEIAVNLSTREIQRGLSVAELVQRVEAAGVSPRSLTLEVTESLLIADAEYARDWLRAARSAGFRIALDDFGTGYSSLAYLRTLPVDVLKVDRSFLHEIPGNAHDAALARGIILTAHSLGLKVVAEGVERREQLGFLEERGCDRVQGFLFSRPVPAHRAAELLRPAGRNPERPGSFSA